MAVVSRRQPSALVSTGLAAATVALNIAGAATDAVPIAKQILNSAAHISAAAERIQKKREAMYTLVEKVDIYATHINIAVAGRVLDASLQRRLERLYSVFLKIEALVDAKAGSKNNALTRVWRNVVTKPNRAETLVVELEREIQLFQLLTGIQLSLVVDNTARAVDDTARAVAADARYDGNLRLLRDCDIEKRDIIDRCETDEGTVVWASARVDGQLLVVRYLESQSNAETNSVTTLTGASHPWGAKYYEYLENVKKVSTVRSSHPHIVQLYGRHVQGPEAVFRAGTFDLWDYLSNLRPREGSGEDKALKRLTLAYKILDASAHLESAHGLTWEGHTAIVDENGEPRIGLFDDIVRANPGQSQSIELQLYYEILIWTNYSYSKETGVVEQVHDSSLHAVITKHLRNGNDTDRLRLVWEVIRQEQLFVEYRNRGFPIISGNLSLSQESIARARLYFETHMGGHLGEDDPYWTCVFFFTRHVLAGGGTNTSSQICISMRRRGDKYTIQVETCRHDHGQVRYEYFILYVPIGFPPLAEVAQAVGLPDDFERSWNGSTVYLYEHVWDEGEQMEEESEIGDGESANRDSGDSEAWGSSEEESEISDGEGTDDDSGGSDAWRWGSSEEEDEVYETADEGETSPNATGED